jgi:hypothetical protein
MKVNVCAEPKCECLYESDCHAIEMIKSPSGKEWAIGGTDTEDRWKFCPWCGGGLPFEANVNTKDWKIVKLTSNL